MELWKIGAILLILFAIAVLLAFSWQRPTRKYLTNTTELFSLFTPYMQKHVSLSLQAVNCKPNKYYYEDSTICFHCGSFDACFSYVWSDRGIELLKTTQPGKMFLKGNYDATTAINFHSFGLTKALNCKCNKQCLCDNGINVKMEDSTVILTSPQNINIKQKIEEAAKEIGECEFGDLWFACGVVHGIFKSE
jgi:hypothetical protein